MLITENIAIAIAAIKANKIRSFLTMLGIIIGISAVIFITTLGSSLSESMQNSISTMGANNIKVSLRQRTDEGEPGFERRFGRTRYEKTNDDLFKEEMVEDLSAHYEEDIENISYNISMGRGKAEQGSDYANVEITGISAEYFDLNKKPTMVEGELLTKKAIDEGRSIALVSDKLCDNLFNGDYENAIGKDIEITVNGKFYSFVICGIYEYEQNSFQRGKAYDISTTVYTTYKYAAKKMHVQGFDSFTVAVNMNKYPKPEVFATKIDSYMNKYYHNNDRFTSYSYSESAQFGSLVNMINAMALVISAIASISLLVAGVGVMNIMMVSVTERTKEIGTRKALGATNNSIRMQFIIESAVLCLIGGLIGIVFGLVLSTTGITLFGMIRGKTYSVSPNYIMILGAVIFSTAVGVFFGYYPANKAAKMNPIDALRY